MKLGRDKEALAALQTAAKLSPGSPQVMMALSEYFMETGDFAEARRHAEAIGDAGTASPHENLARIALAEGDLAAAEKEARAALERYPARRVPRQILGKVLHDRGDYSGALVELDLASRPRRRRERRAAAESAVPPRGLPGPPRPIPRGRGRVPGGDPRSSRATPRPAGRARDALREPGARGRGAPGAHRPVLQLRTPEAYFAASRTYEVPGRSRERGPDSGRGEATVSERQGPVHARRPADGPLVRRSVAEVPPLHLGRRLRFPAAREPSARRRPECPRRRARGPWRTRRGAPGSSYGPCAARRFRDRSSARRCRDRRSSRGSRRPRGRRPPGFRSSGRASRPPRSSRELARVPDHVGVREVDDAGAEPARGQGAHGLLGDLGRAHLRVEVVGRALPGGHEHAVLAGKRRLDAAVEEVRDVRVLLGLGEPQVLDARLGPDVREDVRQVLRGKAAGRPNSFLYSVNPTKLSRGGRGRGKSENVSSVSARVSCRARSARKLKKTTASPSRIGPTGSPSSWRTVGCTNSSVSPRPYAASRAARGALGLEARGEHQGLVRARHAIPSLVAVHGVVTARHRGDPSSRARKRGLEPAEVFAARTVGGVSRPSRNAWTRTRGTPCFAASSSRPVRCRSCECTPPSESSPIRWSVAPLRFAAVMAESSPAFSKNEPSRSARSMRRRSCGTMRPAPSVEVSDLGVAHHAGGQSDGLSGRLEQRPGVFGQPAVEDGRARQGNRVAAARAAACPQPSQIRRKTGAFFKREARARCGASGSGLGRGAAVRARKPALEVRQHVHQGDVRLVGRLVRREIRVDFGVSRGLGGHVVEVIGRREATEVGLQLGRARRPDAPFEREEPLQGVPLQVVALPGREIAGLVGPRDRPRRREQVAAGQRVSIACDGVRNSAPRLRERAGRPRPRRTRRFRSPSAGARRRSRSP